MTNDIANFDNPNLEITTEAFDQAIKHTRAGRPLASSGGSYLKLGRNDGIWSYGVDDVEVDPDTLWQINSYGLRQGWVVWADPKRNGGSRGKLGELMGPFNNPPAMPTTDHTNKSDGWQEQVGSDLVGMSGEDEGEMVTFGSSSRGGLKAYSQLINVIANRPKPDYHHPIVKLRESHYTNKTYGGTTYEPLFEIVDWLDNDRNLLSEQLQAIAQENRDDAVRNSEAADEENPAASEVVDDAKATTRPRRRRNRAS